MMTWLLANWRAVLIGVALLVAFGAGWMTNGWRHEAAAATLQRAAEHERAEAFRWVASEQKRSAAAMAVEDARATGEIRDAQEKTDRLLDCIERGDGCGLRVRIVRAPTKCGPVPEAGAAPGVGDRGGEWAELDGITRQGYRTLRDTLKRRDEALKLCVNQWSGNASE